MNGLSVFRRIDNIEPSARANIALDNHLYEFQDGTTWVDNDQIWDNEIVGYIMDATQGFAVFDQQLNKVAGPFRALDKAEAARKSAKITFVAEVEIEDDDDETALVEAAAASV